MKTTGRYSHKPYRCRACGYERSIWTNHWGECYSFLNHNHCPRCSPMSVTVWDCMEKAPKGYGKPEPWRTVKLGDLMDNK